MFMLFLLNAGCKDKTGKQKSLPESTTGEKTKDSSIDTTASKFDEVMKDRIIDTLMKIPFVKKTNDYLDSLSGHRKGIAFIIDSAGKNEISVTAGYNGPSRFETYYIFAIYPKTFQIMIDDLETGEFISIDQYIKKKKE